MADFGSPAGTRRHALRVLRCVQSIEPQTHGPWRVEVCQVCGRLAPHDRGDPEGPTDSVRLFICSEHAEFLEAHWFPPDRFCPVCAAPVGRSHPDGRLCQACARPWNNETMTTLFSLHRLRADALTSGCPHLGFLTHVVTPERPRIETVPRTRNSSFQPPRWRSGEGGWPLPWPGEHHG